MNTSNYRIIRMGTKYFPQTRFNHIVTTGIAALQPIHEWVYFKDPHGNDQWFKTYDEALKACIEDEKTEKFDEIVEITINHGKIVNENRIR